MLIARAVAKDKNALLIVGLSAENRRRLETGAPIELQIGETAGPLTILLFGGDTEASMQADLFPLIDAQAAVVDRYSQEEE